MKNLCNDSLVNWEQATKTMLIDQFGRNYTYTEVKKATNEFKGRIKKNSLVLICASNDVGSIISYLACLENKNPILMLDKNISEIFFNFYVKNYQPEYLIINKKQNLNIDIHSFEFESHDYKIYRCKSDEPTKFNNQLGLLMTTSGSTGDPKLVRLSLKNIIANADSIISYLNITESDVAITTLPMQYSYGLSIINSHIRAGAAIVLNDRSVIEPLFWETVKEYAVTNIYGVPFTYDLILKLNFTKYIPNSVRILAQAGGNMAQNKILELYEKSKLKKIKFFVMYGQTEASPRMAYLDPEYLPSKAGSIGKPIPGGSIWLESESGEKINSPNIVGELIYEGPNVALGYSIGRDDLLKGDEWLGLLKTGDLALMDTDGFFYIQARKKRFIKISGIRTSLDQIEKNINDNGFVAAVSGKDDSLVVFIEGDFDQEIINTVKSIFKSYRIAKDKYRIDFKSVLPRHQSGKLDYTKLET
jgi:long-chain acyl-CoA synthetase